MGQPTDFEVIASDLMLASVENASKEELETVLKALDKLLSPEGVQFLKQQDKYFESILPLFTRLIFSDDFEISKSCFKHFAAIAEVFRSKLPRIKKSEWWKSYELDLLVKCIPKLSTTISPSDGSWVQIWSFVASLIISSDTAVSKSLNTLLSISEVAFKKGKEQSEVLDQAWLCWTALIDAFGRSPKILHPSKKLNLLMKPLQACHNVSKYRLSTWVHLIEVEGLPATEETIKTLVESLCRAMYKASGEKAVSRHLPDECARTLARILSFEKVVDACLPDIIEVFGACVNSRPSASAIEEVSAAMLRPINDHKDDTKSYTLWKAFLDQYHSCTDSPILAQACEVFFIEVNFQRWVESGTVDSKELTALMADSDFRSKVLLRSIQLVPDDDQKKKSKKSSVETTWTTYCEAYMSWWANHCPASNDGESSASDPPQDHDVQATLALLRHPTPMINWNPSIFKTWSLLCETCHKLRVLPPMIKPIFSALEEQHFQVQKSIDVLSCLFELDVGFCKMSTKVFDALSSTVYSMEVKQVMDTLSLLENVGPFVEMAPVIAKIIKNVNEKCSELDNLNAHKIRTKVGRISRKMEQLSNSSEKESKVKTQRTPFRTQSNFLQRLAKAEERNKTKNTFLSSIFSSGEKTQEDEEKELSVSPSPEESVENVEDVPVKSLKLNEAENVPFLPVLSPVVKEKPDVEVTVAEKENVIVRTASPTISSPANKLKITNARELKTVDSSPATKKVKPMAGQKSTPKKVTPSKVSYFDDDASDCIMVPPKPKTTPLTEHQMEMMSKRRSDIPALYQDLSQDTQLSNNPPTAVVQELCNGVSVKDAPADSEDFVLGTPSPVESTVIGTPERPKSNVKACSAKKLNFNSLMSTPPSKLNLPSVEENGHYDDLLVKEEPYLPSTPLCSNQNGVEGENEGLEKTALPVPKEEGTVVAEEKGKRKRKSEPAKFSPKLTRSKKSLKSTPDAKISRVPENLQEQPKKTETASEKQAGSEKVADLEQVSGISVKPLENGKLEGLTEGALDGDAVGRDTNSVQTEEPMLVEAPDAVTRKRKTEDSSTESAKKPKLEEDSATQKKSSSLKKKKKPFRLSGGSNLENWLVKTERVITPTLSDSPTVKLEQEDELSSQKSSSQEDAPMEEPVVDLNNSEEIVPSTQEIEAIPVLENHVSVSPTVEVEMKENMEGESPARAEADEGEILDEAEAEKSSPTKESVLEKLSRESPNDDIDLIISPSKRHKRASSVFRGEGDAYLTKEAPKVSDDVDDDGPKMSLRERNKSTPSPVPQTRKNLHPLGGRSAKMLRMATSSVPGDAEIGLVTPTRKRESIAPTTYGENWPKGHTEDWVACTPTSSYASPFRSALKKTPLIEETPTRQDLTTSPLHSSAKRKRVVFLDPPVTRGLIYERDSSFGAVHHAHIPNGSPYPTWSGEEDPVAKRLSPKCEPKSRITSEDFGGTIVAPNASEEVRMLIDHSPELESKLEAALTTEELDNFKTKHRLDDLFMEKFATMEPQLRNLIVECFDSVDMVEVVSNWKLKDCKSLCGLPFHFLSLVKNSQDQSLVEVLAAVVFTVPTNLSPPRFVDAEAQTAQQSVDASAQTVSSSNHASCQTHVDTKSCHTSTDLTTTDSSTQADLQLPPVADLRHILQNLKPKQTLDYFCDALKILSSTLPEAET